MQTMGKGRKGEQAGYLDGQFLVAMPAMSDKRFARSVIYMCAHSGQGAMGLIINQRASHITFPELLGQLSISAKGGESAGEPPTADLGEINVHVGGPVETGRGFVLHTSDYFAAEFDLDHR